MGQNQDTIWDALETELYISSYNPKSNQYSGLTNYNKQTRI